MRILVISWFFPPANTIGAVRVSRCCEYLLAQGHDVRVLAGSGLPYPQTLGCALEADRLIYAPWTDVNGLPRRLSSLGKTLLRPLRRPVTAQAASPGGGASGPGGSGGSAPAGGGGSIAAARALLSPLGDGYRNLTNLPDSRIGWYPHATRAARSALRDWQPELIFASGPPFTAFLIAARLQPLFGARLVIEFRDRWVGDPYYPPPAWRGRLEDWWERRIIAKAGAIVTVSEPWAEAYREKYGKPTAVVYNGYDPELLSGPAPGAAEERFLRILYTGRIYPGRRDPSPLFAALAHIGATPADARVDFLGTDETQVYPLAERFGVSDLVSVLPEVPHKEAVELQQAADVLLLMQWNDPKEQGNVPGKLFEYLGARRPILGLGLEDGVPATLIGERQAGFFRNDPRAIADQLRAWITAKRQGDIPALDESARRGFSRQEQFAKLDDFLRGLGNGAQR